MDLVEELRNNPEAGARRLETEYKAGLLALARRLCADEGDAEELVNGTFAEVVRSIDRYRLKPAVNDLGRMPGAAQFMSPEEYAPGAPLDDLTAQYALGALAFFFFGTYASRERAAWMAGEALYRVALRACSEQREARYPTLAEFVADWRRAAGQTV